MFSVTADTLLAQVFQVFLMLNCTFCCICLFFFFFLVFIKVQGNGREGTSSLLKVAYYILPSSTF